MRTLLMFTTLIAAAAMCGCGDRANRSATAPSDGFVAPQGFVFDDTEITDHGVLDIAGRFVIENRRGAPLTARLSFRDWGRWLEEVEGDTIEVTVPASGRLSTSSIGRKARAVSMRLEGAGMISQSAHRFEYMGARVVLKKDSGVPSVPIAEIFLPRVEDQLASSPLFVVSPETPDAPGTFRFGDFFRAVNETGVAIPLELEFRRTKDDTIAAYTIMIVLAAHGEASWIHNERFGAVTVKKAVASRISGNLSQFSVSTGPITIRDSRVVEYRISDYGERGLTADLNEAPD